MKDNPAEGKKCKICGGYFKLSEFNRDKKALDGKANWCKKCFSLTSTKNRNNRIGHYRGVDRDRHSIENMADIQIEKHRERSRIYRNKNKAKTKAQRKLNYAVKKGIIERPCNCENCGSVQDNISGKIYGCIKDHNYPLVVEWLCAPCKYLKHKGSSIHGK